ncbi:MAG TPA: ATP-binding protein [Longimicrobiales bacterium]
MNAWGSIDDDGRPRVRGLRGWWRRQPLERKLPFAFALLLTVVGAFYTAALYREVARSAGSAVEVRLEQVGREVARLAATANNQRLETMRRVVDSVGTPAALALMSNDTMPAVLLTRGLEVAEARGNPSATSLQKLLEDARLLREAGSPGVTGSLFSENGRTFFWQLASNGDADAPGYVAMRRQLNTTGDGRSAAIQTLIGETIVLIANPGDYGGPWVQLEGPEVTPASPPEPGSNRHIRSGTSYLTYTTPVSGARWVIITETPHSVVQGRAAAFATSTIPFMIGFILLGGGLAWVIGKRITRPMRVMANAALAIGSGEYHRRVSVREGGDLGMMARAFNRMAAQVERTNTALDERVRRRTEELEMVNQELQSFSYSVSHDLRSPLRSIDGFSQALLEDYGPQLDATAQDYLKRLRGGAQRMGLLIDDLLMLSRVARQPVDRTHVDMTALAHEVIAELRTDDPSRAVRIDVQEGMTAEADRGLMYVVLQNLLGNAWKFTSHEPDPMIEFGAEDHDGVTVFHVRDNGAGFDMAYANQLFVAFQRLHSNSDFKGTGIGLTTVQRVITRHGGRVWADAALGAGATFYFTVDGGVDAGEHDSAG